MTIRRRLTIIGSMLDYASHIPFFDCGLVFLASLLFLLRDSFDYLTILATHLKSAHCSTCRDRKDIARRRDLVMGIVPEFLDEFDSGGNWQQG